MSELTYTIIRLGLLALLWVFVLSLAAVLRRDIYGTRISRRARGRGRRDRSATPTPARTSAPAPAPPSVTPAGVAAAGAAAGAAGASPGAAPALAPAASQQARPQRRRRLPTTLLVTDGQLAGTSLPLGRAGVLVGRGPECTLVVDDEFASSRHARIFPRAEGWFVEDEGSRNGTTVNGTRVTGAVPVESGAVIKIGRTTLELRA